MLFQSVNNNDVVVIQCERTDPIIYFKIVGKDNRLRTTTRLEFEHNFNPVDPDE